MKKLKELCHRVYMLPVINQILEGLFCIIYYLLLTVFNLSGGAIKINVDGYAIFYKARPLGKVSYRQMFTFWVLSYVFFRYIIDIYNVKAIELKVNILNLFKKGDK